MKAKELAKQFSLSELQTDYFRLSDETALKLRRLANKYGLGKNRKGRSEARQLWYSMQKAQKEYIEELEELAHELKSGMRYCELMPKVCVQEDIWSTVLSYGYGNNGGGQYWFWRHYGSSAEDATLDGLKFIIEDIFGMTVEEFKKKYKPFKNE